MCILLNYVFIVAYVMVKYLSNSNMNLNQRRKVMNLSPGSTFTIVFNDSDFEKRY